jgi:hypothetical protein
LLSGDPEGERVVTENDMTNGNRPQPIKNNYTLLALGGIVLALAGFLLGRAYPAHDYHQIGTSSYLYDTHTGKLCAPFRESELALAAAKKSAAQPGSDMFDAVQASWDKQHQTAEGMIPACGF